MEWSVICGREFEGVCVIEVSLKHQALFLLHCAASTSLYEYSNRTHTKSALTIYGTTSCCHTPPGE